MNLAKCMVCGKVLHSADNAVLVRDHNDDRFGMYGVACSLECAETQRARYIERYQKKIQFIREETYEVVKLESI